MPKTQTPKETDTLKQVFVDQLRDLYSAETQITKALPKMAKAATSPDLKKGFELHLKQTEGHVVRIKTICEALGVAPTGKTCAATAGLVEEGQETIDEPATPEMKDVMLIGAARRVEHYEIAAYTGTCDLARVLELPDALKLLSETLSEEVATDDILAKANVPALATAHASEE
jgi:ferritin-like metal-binding protein YciE